VPDDLLPLVIATDVILCKESKQVIVKLPVNETVTREPKSDLSEA